MSKKSWKAILLTVALVMFLAALPAASAPDSSAEGFRGFCTCGCSFVRDCNTDADCGSGRCLKGPTCC